MNITLYYIFEIGLLIVVLIAIVVAFLEATRPGENTNQANESTED